MKRILIVTAISVFALHAVAQTVTDSTTTPKKKDWSKVNLNGRANDHFMLQLGGLGWTQKPDTLNTTGLARTFNVYFMFDFPFKTDARFSVAVGAGVGTDNMYFKDTRLDLINTTRLSFISDTSTNYKKVKLTTAYLEAPIELRFAKDPENIDKSFKVAIGVKIGTMIDAHVKEKITSDNSGQTNYTVKYKSRRYFNSTRLAATGRVGIGHFSLFGTYQFTQFIKSGYGPDVRPFTIGLALSGL